MLIVQRQNLLLDILRLRRAAQLDDLARELDVSASTVRRDLDTLSDRGLVARTHGGAVYCGDEDGDTAVQNATVLSPTLKARLNESVSAKESIARFAAAQVEPHMTLLLDGGSTIVIASQLIEVRPLQIVTNSLAIANIFADDEQVELTILGGQLYPRSGVVVGPIATGCLADLYADLCLFSAASIHDDSAYNINLDMARVEQMMIQQSTRSLLLMDSTKFGRKSMIRVCGLTEVDQIVTDDRVSQVWRELLGDRLIVPES